MAEILVLDVPTGAEKLSRLLGEHHNIISASSATIGLTLAEAMAFDAIIVGPQFNESKMFETFEALKGHPLGNRSPVLACAVVRTEMTKRYKTTLEACVLAFGADEYIDGTVLSDDEIVSRIERCIRRSPIAATASLSA